MTRNAPDETFFFCHNRQCGSETAASVQLFELVKNDNMRDWHFFWWTW